MTVNNITSINADLTKADLTECELDAYEMLVWWGEENGEYPDNLPVPFAENDDPEFWDRVYERAMAVIRNEEKARQPK